MRWKSILAYLCSPSSIFPPTLEWDRFLLLLKGNQSSLETIPGKADIQASIRKAVSIKTIQTIDFPFRIRIKTTTSVTYDCALLIS